MTSFLHVPNWKVNNMIEKQENSFQSALILRGINFGLCLICFYKIVPKKGSYLPCNINFFVYKSNYF